ncbi:MAG: penicillin-binding protein 2 [Chloroflexota bacterium]|nr:penicillin-binding protein 2 [Chloroflexota bacterium]
MLRGPDTRLRLITSLLVAALLPVIAQLVRIQILEHPRYVEEAEQLIRRHYGLPEPPWGTIWDRQGALLIGNTPVYDVGIEANLITDTVQTARQLAPLLARPPAEIQADLTLNRAEKTLVHVWRPLAKDIPQATQEKIAALGVPGITFSAGWRRYYAEGELAAHLLGFVNEAGQGAGVQPYYLRFLQGKQVSNQGEVTPYAEPLAEELANEHTIPYPGTDLYLTIDRTLQAYVEGELAQAIREYHAESGTILVSAPRTGEILALANYPTYEPARYSEYAARDETDCFQNPAISYNYEPGSVFKVVTAAAALDSGRVDLDWSYQDVGSLEYGGVVVKNWNRAAYGQQDLEGALAHSLNVGMATLSTRVLGKELFYDYVRAFGFGQPTGVGLAGEAAGVVHTPTDWDWAESFLATNAYGQGIAVTPLQMLSAVGAVANEGTMMRPYVVGKRVYPDGEAVRVPPHPLGQPISPETAETLTELLARVVEREIPLAQVSGYRIAGKSGTAQIPGVGGYEQEAVIASFIGFGPLPEPQLLIFVKLDRPAVAPAYRWGSYTAAPVFQRVAERLFVLLGIPPDDVVATSQ